MDVWTVPYEEIGCQTEIKKRTIMTAKRQIQAAGFTIFGWDIIFLSHGFQPVDMLVF